MENDANGNENMKSGAIPSGWKTIQLKDLGQIVTGKTPSTRFPEYFSGDIPFITPSDMDGRKIISETDRNISPAGAATVAGSTLPPRAVMVSCIGSDMGKVALTGRACVTNQQINSIIVNDGFSVDFIYYNLFNRKSELQNLAGGRPVR